MNYKRLSIALVIILLFCGVAYFNGVYDNYIMRRTETRIAKFQTNNLQFLMYQNNQTTLITAQQLYLYFQQMEQGK